MKTYRVGSTILLRNGDTRKIIRDSKLHTREYRYSTIDNYGEVMVKWYDSLEELLTFYANIMKEPDAPSTNTDRTS